MALSVLTMFPTFAEAGDIRGVVYAGTDSSARISGATVKANGSTVTTDSAGAWRFTVPAGTYTVTASAAGYEAGSTQCTLPSDLPEKWCSFGLEPASTVPTTGTITGLLTDADSGAAISGASISAGGATAYTSGDGRFALTLAAGTYTLVGTAAGYDTGTKNCSVAAGSSSTCSFSLARTSTKGSLQGVVYQNGSTSDLVAPATVSVSGVGSVLYGGSAMWIFSVEPGTYGVTASASGYNSGFRTCQVRTGAATDCSVELTRPQQSGGEDAGSGEENDWDGGSVPLPGTGVLQGVVYRNGNRADTVAPATVVLNGVGSTVYRGLVPWAFTVQAGTYIVEVSAQGYVAVSRTCVAEAGETRDCSVELTAQEASEPEEQADGGSSAEQPSGALSGEGQRGGDMSSLAGGCSVAGGASEWALWGWLSAAAVLSGRKRRRLRR